MTFREAACRKALQFKGVREDPPGSNSGLWVNRFLASVGLKPGYPWCMAWIHYIFECVGLVLGGYASVGYFAEWARQHGDVVYRPFRGDIVCYQFDADTWPDHVGLVLRVLRVGPFGFLLRVIEGNTSSGNTGSQADGGGVYIRTRFVREGRAIYCRIPGGKLLLDPPAQKYRIVRRHFTNSGRDTYSLTVEPVPIRVPKRPKTR